MHKTMYSDEMELCLDALKNAYSITEYEFYEEGKGTYGLLRDIETAIKYLEKALDPIRGLEIDGII